MISSIEYSRENEGIAITIRISAGTIVQIISTTGACTRRCVIPVLASAVNPNW